MMFTIILVSHEFSFLSVQLNLVSSVPTNCIAGPIVDTKMTLSLLSSRDDQNIMFTFSFNASYGPPTGVWCWYDYNTVVNADGVHPQVVREVIRSHYISSSQPDMTRVKVTLTGPREAGTYTCTVTVQGRRNFQTSPLTYVHKGTATSTATITGKCVW